MPERAESRHERYRTIVADPPWEGDFTAARVDGIGGYAFGSRTVQHYSTMTLDEIRALPVRDLSAVEAHLYLWTTASFLRDAYGVAEAWGFEPMYPLVWCKPSKGRGLGGKFQSNVEFCLFCRDRAGAQRVAASLRDAAERAGVTIAEINRHAGVARMAMWWLGKGTSQGQARVPTWEQWERLKALLPVGDEHDDEVRAANEERQSDRRSGTRWWEWPRGAHSAKPEAFLDIVESVSPGPYLEMFARRARFGWDYWGDQSLGTAALEKTWL